MSEHHPPAAPSPAGVADDEGSPAATPASTGEEGPAPAALPAPADEGPAPAEAAEPGAAAEPGPAPLAAPADAAGPAPAGGVDERPATGPLEGPPAPGDDPALPSALATPAPAEVPADRSVADRSEPDRSEADRPVADRPEADRPAPSEAAPAPADEPAQRAPVADGRRRNTLLVALLVAIVAVGGVLIYRQTSDRDRQAAPPGTTAPTLPPGPTVEYETHRDDAAGFSIKYPRSWERVESPDPVVRFMVRDDLHALQVRYAVFEQAITKDNIADIKAVSDADLSDEQDKITILRHQLIEMNGMPGYHYLYTFKDEATGVEGAHSRYNLYQGRKAYVLVFQAMPVDDFDKVAGIFDAMAESFQATPDVGPPPTTDRPPLGFQGSSSPPPTDASSTNPGQ